MPSPAPPATSGRDASYSCVLDTAHWETALRYIDLNPVRARLTQQSEDHPWSSARAHLGLDALPPCLDLDQFSRHWPSPAQWRESLATLTRREVATLRRATRHDAALGSDAFVQDLERTFAVQLCARPLGRPRKSPAAESSPTGSATAQPNRSRTA